MYASTEGDAATDGRNLSAVATRVQDKGLSPEERPDPEAHEQALKSISEKNFRGDSGIPEIFARKTAPGFSAQGPARHDIQRLPE